ncbi:uncharacterized protein LOC108336982 [Vigna angularis]|uniref:uncharacterized protein LOC108336982 n=1 Tax=Phaseolus angularis TaxID=3914 RepID=UPI000809C095|nr:uncharacterized protein LOC108336982 [Vigna angularis]
MQQLRNSNSSRGGGSTSDGGGKVRSGEGGGSFDIKRGGGGGYDVRSGEGGGFDVESGGGEGYDVRSGGGGGYDGGVRWCCGGGGSCGCGVRGEGGGWFEYDVTREGGGCEHMVGHEAHSVMHNEPVEGSSMFSSDATMHAHKPSTMNPTFLINGNRSFCLNL